MPDPRFVLTEFEMSCIGNYAVLIVEQSQFLSDAILLRKYVRVWFGQGVIFLNCRDLRREAVVMKWRVGFSITYNCRVRRRRGYHATLSSTKV